MAAFSSDVSLKFSADASQLVKAAQAYDALIAKAKAYASTLQSASGATGGASGQTSQHTQATKQNTQAQNAATAAANRYMAALKLQAATQGMSKTQILAHKAALHGVSAAAAPFINQLQSANLAATKLNGSVGSLNGSVGGLKGMFGGMGGMFSGLAGGLSAMGAAMAAVKIATTADEVRMLGARVEVAAGSVDEGKDAMARLVEMSKASQTSVGANVDVFQRLNSSMKQMGGTQEDTLQLTDLLGKAVKVSGSSAAEASASMLQFGQALGSGKLAGDELKSLMETSPYLMKQLAEGLGVPIGALKKMGSEGKLTAEVVVGAMTKMSGKINEDFAKMPKTVSGAMQVAQDAAGRTALAFDNMSGTSATLAGATQGVGSVLEELAKQFKEATSEADVLGRNDSIQTWADRVKVVLSYVADAGDLISRMFRQMGTLLGGVAASAGAALEGNFSGARDVLKDMWGDLQKIGNAKFSGSQMRDAWEQGPATRRKDFAAYTPSKLKSTNTDTDKKKGSKADPFATMLESVRNTTAEQKEQLVVGDDMTKAQQLQAKFLEQIKNGTMKVTAEKKAQMLSALSLLNTYELEERERKEGADNEKKYAEEQSKNALDRLEIFTKAKDMQNEMLESLKFEASTLGLSTREKALQTDLRKLDVELQKELNELIAKGASQEELSKARNNTGTAKFNRIKLDEDQKGRDNDGTAGFMQGIKDYAGQTKTAFESMQEIGTRVTGTLENAFMNMARTGKLSFKDMAASIIADLGAIAMKAAVSGIAKLIMSSFGGGMGGLTSAGATSDYNALGAIDAARASGGPVSAGQVVRVGEQGPEDLLLGSGGYVGKAGKFSGGSQPINITQGSIVIQGNATDDNMATLQTMMAERDAKMLAQVQAISRQTIMNEQRPRGLLSR